MVAPRQCCARRPEAAHQGRSAEGRLRISALALKVLWPRSKEVCAPPASRHDDRSTSDYENMAMTIMPYISRGVLGKIIPCTAYSSTRCTKLAAISRQQGFITASHQAPSHNGRGAWQKALAGLAWLVIRRVAADRLLALKEC